MMPVWVAFFVGLFLGVLGGVVIMCLLQVNRQDSDFSRADLPASVPAGVPPCSCRAFSGER